MKEVLDAVNMINEELLENNEWLESSEFDLLLAYSVSCFNMSSVTYLGNRIWTEADDDREYYEETDTYMDMYCHLKLKMMELRNAINSVKF